MSASRRRATLPERSLRIADVEIRPGERRSIRVPLSPRYSHTEVFLPVHVVHGRAPGPCLFVSAAIHGDELNGVEIVRRLLRRRALSRLRGTLIAVPIVNVYGFVVGQRDLPDRRDLNRSFPGSARGSLTARLADVFMREVVGNATHGIDLHTGSMHRRNLPQIRARLDDPDTRRLAEAFGVPVAIDANLRDGSLRQAVLERKMPILLYEAGEALRFDETSIRVGLRGIMAVMRALGMLPPSTRAAPPGPFLARSSTWVRSPASGIVTGPASLGAGVQPGDVLGVITDALGEEEVPIECEHSGVIVGRLEMPLVHEGDALFHVARFEEPGSIAEQLAAFGIET